MRIFNTFSIKTKIATLLAARLQRSISGPLLELSKTIQTIADTKNYSIRIPRRSNDEFGVFIDSFNDMLAEIEKRDSELVRQNSRTMEQIAICTRDLQKVKAKAEVASLIQPRELIEDLGELFSNQAHRKTLELVCDLPTTMHQTFVGDAGRLRQVLSKLIGNAVKYTEKGEIVVRIEVVKESAADAVLRFQVKDTGIGITREQQPGIFEIFSQSDATSSRISGNTGLGIAIAKRLVEQMDGQMGMESQPGKGTLFWFRLKLAKSTVDKLSLPPSEDLHGLRILVVDDNAANRELLKRDLTALGAETEATAKGQDALRLLRAAAADRPYNLALIDRHMAGLNGLALAYTVTADTTLPITCIMMLSSLDGPDAVEACRSVGVYYHLTKPVRQKTLLETVHAATRGGDITASQADASITPTERPEGKKALDPKTLAELRRMGADESFFKRLVTVYLNKSDSDLTALRDALAANNAETVYQITHRFKSSSNNLGALPLASLCAELEVAARRRDLRCGPRIFTAIEQEYQQVRNLFEQELASPESANPEPPSQKPESYVRL